MRTANRTFSIDEGTSRKEATQHNRIMRYAICDKAKAIDNGYMPDVHRRKGNAIVLNEKEVMQNPNLKGTFEERIAGMAGYAVTEQEMTETINKGDWQ